MASSLDDTRGTGVFQAMTLVFPVIELVIKECDVSPYERLNLAHLSSRLPGKQVPTPK
jgi:hypothetical protein